jgi:predicted AAA+ superfamily ATPase
MTFNRHFVSVLHNRITTEELPLSQVILGPRQVGKTTGVKTVLQQVPRGHYANADLARAPTQEWIIEQWQIAKALGKGAILALDEIHKIERWSDVIKGIYDEDRGSGAVKIIVMGSASLALREGLGDSLLGRFELVEVPHWSFWESKAAFGWDLNQHLMFGGYPGAAHLVADAERWQAFMRDSVIESVLAKDIFMLAKIGKPALFRQVLEIALLYPSQEISYQKIVGQLHESGSVETVKSYLSILGSAYLIQSLEKFSTRSISVKSSSPKLIPLCPALAHALQSPSEILRNPTWRGRVLEATVGAHLAKLPNSKLYYWRDGRDEVDFVIKSGSQVLGIEVKSGGQITGHGVAAFRAQFKEARCVTLTEPIALQLLERDASTSACLEWLKSIAI